MPNLYKKFNFKSSIIKNIVLILLATITLMIVGMIVKAIGITSHSSILGLTSLPQAQADAPSCSGESETCGSEAATAGEGCCGGDGACDCGCY